MCAVLEDGSVKCWGGNDVGQLGYGDKNNRGDDAGEMGDALPAVALGTGRTAVSIAASSLHTCALLDSGSVKCWGWNTFGQLGYGDTIHRGDDAGEMGDALPAVDLGTGRKAVSIAAGWYHTCAVLDNGSLKCWGYNTWGGLGYGDKIRRGDEVGEMGDALPAVALGAGRQAVSIAIGESHTCAVLDNGSLKCWGSNFYGQLGYGDTNDRGDGGGEMGDALPAVSLGAGRTAVSIAAGALHTCAVLDNRSMKCWGRNNRGQLGYGDMIDRGDNGWEMGDNLPTISVGTSRTVLNISTYFEHTCAILDDSSVKCWGRSDYAQLGYNLLADQGDSAGEMGDSLETIIKPGSTECTACDYGEFQSNSQETSCDTCSQDEYASSLGSTTCSTCSVSNLQYSVAGSASCTQCDPGQTFNYDTGDCSDCAQNTKQVNNECIACDTGSFSTAKSDSCTICSGGTHWKSTEGACRNCTNNDEIPNVDECVPCPSDEFSIPGQASCTSCGSTEIFDHETGECRFCAAGKERSGYLTCRPCDTNEFSTGSGNACETCSAHSYSTGGSSTCTSCADGTEREESEDSCTNCPANTYSIEGSGCLSCTSHSVSASGSSTCTNCAAGYERSISQTSCTACADNFYSESGSACTSCQDHYVSESGDATCSPCPDGQKRGTSESVCTNCADNQYSTGGSGCTACDPNTFSTAGSGECTACPDGQKRGTSESECTNCADNQYSTGGSGCTACATNTFSTAGDATCSPCPAGQEPGSTTCVNCERGKISNGDSGNCFPCPVDTYAPFPASTQCYPCPGGTSTNGEIEQSSCSMQADGYSSGPQSIVSNYFSLKFEPEYYKHNQLTLPIQIAATNNTIAILFVSSTGSSSESFNVGTHPCVASDNDVCCLDSLFGDASGVTTESNVQAFLYENANVYTKNADTCHSTLPNPANSIPGVAPYLYPDIRVASSLGATPQQKGPIVEIDVTFTLEQLNNFASPIEHDSSFAIDAYRFYIGVVFLSLSSHTDTVSITVAQRTVRFFKSKYSLMSVGLDNAETLEYRNCSAGFYQDPFEPSGCGGCPPGTFSATINAEDVNTCELCPEDTFSLGSAGQCSECPYGTRSTPTKVSCVPRENWNPFGDPDDFTCVGCPLGRYMNRSDVFGYNCVRCSPGTYTEHYSLKNATTTCSSCAPGTFQGEYGRHYCEACRAGEYQPNSAASSCIKCEPGTFSAELQSTEPSCSPCGEGTFSAIGGASTCSSCPLGSRSSKLSASRFCEKCPQGTYGATENGVNRCRACGFNEKNESLTTSVIGATNASFCKSQAAIFKLCDEVAEEQCDTSTHILVGCGGLERGVCQSCEDIELQYCTPKQTQLLHCGEFRNPGCCAPPGFNCTKRTVEEINSINNEIPRPFDEFRFFCPAGTFRVQNTYQCEPCAPHTFSPQKVTIFFNQTSSCLPCPNRTVAPEEGSLFCSYCEPGQELNASSSMCVSCVAGFTSDGNSSSCYPCPADSFSPAPGVPGCTPCAPNTTTNELEGQVECVNVSVPVETTSTVVDGGEENATTPIPLSNVSNYTSIEENSSNPIETTSPANDSEEQNTTVETSVTAEEEFNTTTPIPLSNVSNYTSIEENSSSPIETTSPANDSEEQNTTVETSVTAEEEFNTTTPIPLSNVSNYTSIEENSSSPIETTSPANDSEEQNTTVETTIAAEEEFNTTTPIPLSNVSNYTSIEENSSSPIETTSPANDNEEQNTTVETSVTAEEEFNTTTPIPLSNVSNYTSIEENSSNPIETTSPANDSEEQNTTVETSVTAEEEFNTTTPIPLQNQTNDTNTSTEPTEGTSCSTPTSTSFTQGISISLRIPLPNAENLPDTARIRVFRAAIARILGIPVSRVLLSRCDIVQGGTQRRLLEDTLDIVFEIETTNTEETEQFQSLLTQEALSTELEGETVFLQQTEIITESTSISVEQTTSTVNENTTSISVEQTTSTVNEDTTSISVEQTTSTVNEDTTSISVEQTTSTVNEDTTSISVEQTTSTIEEQTTTIQEEESTTPPPSPPPPPAPPPSPPPPPPPPPPSPSPSPTSPSPPPPPSSTPAAAATDAGLAIGIAAGASALVLIGIGVVVSQRKNTRSPGPSGGKRAAILDNVRIAPRNTSRTNPPFIPRNISHIVQGDAPAASEEPTFSTSYFFSPSQAYAFHANPQPRSLHEHPPGPTTPMPKRTLDYRLCERGVKFD